MPGWATPPPHVSTSANPDDRPPLLPPQTTTLSTCVNKRIQWSGGRPPYSVRVFPGGQLDADPLAVIALNTQDTNAVWRCTVEAGQSVTFAVEDDNGDVNGSAQVVVTEKCAPAFSISSLSPH